MSIKQFWLNSNKGTKTLTEQAFGSLRRGGSAVFVGLPADQYVQLSIFAIEWKELEEISKEVIGIHVLPTRSLFGERVGRTWIPITSFANCLQHPAFGSMFSVGAPRVDIPFALSAEYMGMFERGRPVSDSFRDDRDLQFIIIEHLYCGSVN
jgi:hypothetical protein